MTPIATLELHEAAAGNRRSPVIVVDGFRGAKSSDERILPMWLEVNIPFAPTSVSVGLHAADSSATAILNQLLEQARVADRNGYDGVTIAEHHGGGGGYLPNPLQFVGWAIQEMSQAWAATGPLLLPLRNSTIVIEEIAWLNVRFPGRVGICVGPGFASLDFQMLDVPFQERLPRFRAGLEGLASALAGRATGGLENDLAVAQMTNPAVPLVATVGGPIGASHAARAGAGAMVDSFASIEKARSLFERYSSAGGPGPKILCRRAWLGEPDESRMQALARARSGPDAAAAIGAPQADFTSHRNPATLARLLAESVRRAGADSLLLKFFFPGVRAEQITEQIARTGIETVPLVKQELAAR